MSLTIAIPSLKTSKVRDGYVSIVEGDFSLIILPSGASTFLSWVDDFYKLKNIDISIILMVKKP